MDLQFKMESTESNLVAFPTYFAHFLPKFFNEAVHKSKAKKGKKNPNESRSLMIELVGKGTHILEVTFKHSGSLALFNGQVMFAKNSTGNVFSHAMELVFLEYFKTQFLSQSDPEEHAKKHFKELCEYLVKEHLTIGMETVCRNILKHHGAMPQMTYVVITSITKMGRPQEEQFMSYSEIVQFCSHWGLPWGEGFVFTSEKTVNDFWDICDRNVLLGHTKDLVKDLTESADVVFPSPIPHDVVQGDILEGFVVKCVPKYDIKTVEKDLKKGLELQPVEPRKAFTKLIDDIWARNKYEEDGIDKEIQDINRFPEYIQYSFGPNTIVPRPVTDKSKWKKVFDLISQEGKALRDGVNKLPFTKENEDILRMFELLERDGQMRKIRLKTFDITTPADKMAGRKEYFAILHVIYNNTFEKYGAGSPCPIPLYRGFSIRVSVVKRDTVPELDGKQTGGQRSGQPSVYKEPILKYKLLAYKIRTFCLRQGLQDLAQEMKSGADRFVLRERFFKHCMRWFTNWSEKTPGLTVNDEVKVYWPILEHYFNYCFTYLTNGSAKENETRRKHIAEGYYLDIVEEADRLPIQPTSISTQKAVGGRYVLILYAGESARGTVVADANSLVDSLKGKGKTAVLKVQEKNIREYFCVAESNGLTGLIDSQVQDGVFIIECIDTSALRLLPKTITLFKRHVDHTSVFLLDSLDSSLCPNKGAATCSSAWKGLVETGPLSVCVSTTTATNDKGKAVEFPTAEDIIKCSQTTTSATTLPLMPSSTGPQSVGNIYVCLCPTIPGTAKSSLFSGRLRTHFDATYIDGDDVKKAYDLLWTKVSATISSDAAKKATGKPKGHLFLIAKNMPFRMGRGDKDLATYSSFVGTAPFMFTPIWTLPQDLGWENPKHSSKDVQNPFSIHLLLLCIARVLARVLPPGAKGSRLSSDICPGVICMFHNFYNGVTRAELIELLLDCGKVVEYPFLSFNEKPPVVPQELYDVIMEGKFGPAVRASEHSAPRKAFDRKCSNAIEKHRRLIESWGLGLDESVEYLIKEIEKIMSTKE